MFQLENRWLDVLDKPERLHRFRHGIALLLDKGESAIRRDKYERYDEVVRPTFQAAYADILFDWPGRQALHAFLQKPLDKVAPLEGPLLELGCGTGRLLWELLQKAPKRTVVGIDFSYNMLRQAADILLKGRRLEIDARARGLGERPLQLPASQHLLLGQANAKALPFPDACFALILQSFLLDRLPEPVDSLKEQWRLLKKGGQWLILSPLNFQQASHWELLGSPAKLCQILEDLGANILHQEELLMRDRLDARGNQLQWNTLAIWAEKPLD